MLVSFKVYHLSNIPRFEAMMKKSLIFYLPKPQCGGCSSGEGSLQDNLRCAF